MNILKAKNDQNNGFILSIHLLRKQFSENDIEDWTVVKLQSKSLILENRQINSR